VQHLREGLEMKIGFLRLIILSPTEQIHLGYERFAWTHASLVDLNHQFSLTYLKFKIGKTFEGLTKFQ